MDTLRIVRIIYKLVVLYMQVPYYSVLCTALYICTFLQVEEAVKEALREAGLKGGAKAEREEEEVVDAVLRKVGLKAASPAVRLID